MLPASPPFLQWHCPATKAHDIDLIFSTGPLLVRLTICLRAPISPIQRSHHLEHLVNQPPLGKLPFQGGLWPFKSVH